MSAFNCLKAFKHLKARIALFFTALFFIAFFFISASGLSLAASVGVPLQQFKGDPYDLPSLQRGASTYVNYCLGCHSLSHQRYQRTAQDLGIPEKLFAEHLIVTGAKIGDHIKSAMDPNVSKNWFGVAPPDLTMVTRVRTTDWVYSYLKSFYRDDSRPFGVNNKVFPNVAMPHALIALQGVPEPTCREVPAIAANGGEVRDPLIPGKKITQTQCGHIEATLEGDALSAEGYDQVVSDLVNFLDYVGEPSRKDRHRIGIFVLCYIAIFFAFAYLLNKEYWRNIR